MRHHRTGFTLIETLIYVAFIGLIMTSMTLLAYTAFTVRGKLRAALILEQNIRFSTARITTLVTEASSITTPSLGTSSGTLVLVMSATSSNPTTITTTNGTVYVTQGATGTAQALTSDEVAITSLVFSRVSSTTGIVRVVNSGGLRNAAPGYATLTSTTTVSIRR